MPFASISNFFNVFVLLYKETTDDHYDVIIGRHNNTKDSKHKWDLSRLY